MAYKIVHRLLRRAEKLLARVDGHKIDEHREIVMKTNGVWPSADELALRDALEKAVNASGIAEVLGADAGDGSVSLWIRMRSGAEPKAKPKAELKAELKKAPEDEKRVDVRKLHSRLSGKLHALHVMDTKLAAGKPVSLKIPDPPPTEGDGTPFGFLLLLLDEFIAEAHEDPVATSWLQELRREVCDLADRMSAWRSPVGPVDTRHASHDHSDRSACSAGRPAGRPAARAPR